MQARAKSTNTPYPIWVYGEYITDPPPRPADNIPRPTGHYIDKGGYPGANIYRIDITTLCPCTGIEDQTATPVYARDILLQGTREGYTYMVMTDARMAEDLLTGEAITKEEITEDIRVIGNTIDHPDFAEGLAYYATHDIPLPYIPALSMQGHSIPYFLYTCTVCKVRTIGARYRFRCPTCGGLVLLGYTTDIKREKNNESCLD